MSSVSAACIFDTYSASSAHTDTFYIVSQIVRVRNSKRHFFSKLTFRISFNRSASPYGHIDHNHNCSASPYGHINHNRPASLYGNIDHNRPASPYGSIDPRRSASPYGNIDHSRSASPYGNIDHNCPASPYDNIDHNPLFRTTKPFEQLCRKFFVFF